MALYVGVGENCWFLQRGEATWGGFVSKRATSLLTLFQPCLYKYTGLVNYVSQLRLIHCAVDAFVEPPATKE